MNELELKKEFAYNLKKYPDNAFKAALMVFPDDNGLALRMAKEWPIDKEVLMFIKELDETTDPLDYVPGRADLAREIWEKMKLCTYADDYAKLAAVYLKTISKEQKAEGIASLGEAFAEISKRLPV